MAPERQRQRAAHQDEKHQHESIVVWRQLENQRNEFWRRSTGVSIPLGPPVPGSRSTCQVTSCPSNSCRWLPERSASSCDRRDRLLRSWARSAPRYAPSTVVRRAEIGVRVALGAGRGDIVRSVLGSVGRVTALGIVRGLVASLGGSRLIASMLFDTSPTDPVTLAGVAMVLASVALAASYWPARRALAVDPIVALRND